MQRLETADNVTCTARVQTGYGTTTVSEVDTVYAPCACSPIGEMCQETQPYLPPNSSPPATTHTYDALGAQVFILLHELGHVFGAPGFQNDASGNNATIRAAQENNNDLVWKNCAGVIAAAGGIS
jgi:hypothetical protein